MIIIQSKIEIFPSNSSRNKVIFYKVIVFKNRFIKLKISLKCRVISKMMLSIQRKSFKLNNFWAERILEFKTKAWIKQNKEMKIDWLKKWEK
jgi:hypothetical protein